MKIILSILIFLAITSEGKAQPHRKKVMDNVTGKMAMIEDDDSTYSFPTVKGYTFIKSGDSVTIKITKSWLTVEKDKVEFSGATKMPDGTIQYSYSIFYKSKEMWANPGHRQFYEKDIRGNQTLTEDR